MNATYLCGKQLAYPFTIEYLGEGFTFDESTIKPESMGISVDMLYNGEKLCSLCYDCTKEELSPSQPIGRILFFPEDKNKDKLSINGLTANDSMNKIKDALGEPTRGEGTYVTNDYGTLIVTSDMNDKVFGITFNLKQDEHQSALK